MLHAKRASTAQSAAHMTDGSRSGKAKRKGSSQQSPAEERRQQEQSEDGSGISDDDGAKQAKLSDSVFTVVTSRSTVSLLSADDGLQPQQAVPMVVSPRSAQNLAPAFSTLQSTPSPSTHPVFPPTPLVSSSILARELRRLPSPAVMSDALPALPSPTSAFHSPSASSTLSSSPAVAAPSPVPSPFLSPPLPLPPPAQLALPDLKAFEREASIEKKRRSRRRSSNPAPVFPPSNSPTPRGLSTQPIMKRFAAPAPRERLQPPSTPMKTPVSAARDAGITIVFRSPFVAAIAPASSIGLGELALPTPSPLSTRQSHPLRGLQQTTPSRPLFQPIVDELSMPPLAASPPPAAASRATPSAPPSPLHPLLSSTAASPFAMKPSAASALSSLLLPSPFGLPSSSVSASYFSSEFTVLSELGRGDFGVVFLCRWHADNALYAVKKSLKPLRTASQRLRACREVQHFASLLPPPSASLGSFSSPSLSSPHPNVLSYMQAWVEDAHLHIQTEYLPAGTLRDAIAAADEPIAEERIWDWTAQLLQGLSFLHSHRLIHLDIKPDNVFLTRDGGLKIGDLGTSVREGSRAGGAEGGAAAGGGSEEGREEVEEGDAVYIAPELLDPSLGAVSAKADVFSLGLTLFEISADVILPTRGSAWNELRHERIDWAGSSYFLSDSPVSSASPDVRWMQTGHRAHNARAAAAGCISPIVMESAALQEERGTELAGGGLKAQRRLSTPIGRPMPSPPKPEAERAPDVFRSPVMQSHSVQQQTAAAEAEDEPAVSTPLVRSHLRTRSTPCSSFCSPSAPPLSSYDSPAVTKSSLPPLHPSQSSASLSSSAEDVSHCSLPTLKRRRSSSVSLGAGAGRSVVLQSLVMSLLRRDPARRPTVAELLQHQAVLKAMDRRRDSTQAAQQRSVRVTEPRKLFDERGRLL